MKWLTTYVLFILFTFTGGHTCIGQVTEKDDSVSFEFVPGEKVIFEDDFSEDSLGKFPSKWRLYPTISKLEISDSITNTGVYPIAIQASDSGHELAIASDNHYFPLKPKIKIRDYLTDTFTIEFDFRKDNDQSDPAIVFFDAEGNNVFETRILSAGEILSTLMHETRYSVDYPGTNYNYQAWHHFALAYKHRQITLFIDKHFILQVPDSRSAPSNFIIAGNSYTDGKPVVAFKNIRLATDIPNMFNKILTENKFVTHAIHFKTGQSAIEPESMDFIKQLAVWLKANPAVILEIDGYTDNDGDIKANLKLSKERASAVKATLESLGTDKARITTNGFGEGFPIDNNATPEGKAQNRRVEFVRLKG